MPRKARVRSGSGIYHVLLSGAGKQGIFHDESDYRSYQDILKIYRDDCGFRLYAFCLMPDHIHLLLQENPEFGTVSQIMRRVSAKFVYWYNLRHAQNGPLFHDRFRSETVEDFDDFMKVMRAMHLNPVCEGMAAKPEEYAYSSYGAYVKDDADDLVDTTAVYSIMDRDRFTSWHAQDGGDGCLEPKNRDGHPGITDEKALKSMKKSPGAASPEEFKLLKAAQQDEAIRRMRQDGASLRQISRLTGVSFALVRKALKKVENPEA